MLIPFTSASFTNLSGLAVADGAEVEVRLESNGALAALFDDRGGTTPLTNPFNADSQGRFAFYVAGVLDGYSVEVTKGAQTHIIHHQLTSSASAMSYVQLGTDARERPVLDKLRELSLSIMDFDDADNSGATDQTATLVRVMNKAFESATLTDNVVIDLPYGEYLFTQANPFGSYNVSADARQHVTFRGAGRYSTRIRFKPGGSANAYLYDGSTGDGSTPADNQLLFALFEGIGFIFDETGMTGGTLNFVRQCPKTGAPNQNFQHRDCYFEGPSTAARAGVIQTLRGTINAAENSFWNCRGTQMRTVIDSTNSQAVNHYVFGCDWETMVGDVYKFVDGGGQLVHVGGSIIYGTTLGSEAFVLNLQASTGLGTNFNLTGIKTELNSVNSKLLNLSGTNNAAIVHFWGTDHSTTSSSGSREMVSMQPNCPAYVTFQRSNLIPNGGGPFLYAFKDAPLNYYLGAQFNGCIEFNECRLPSDIHSHLLWGTNANGLFRIRGVHHSDSWNASDPNIAFDCDMLNVGMARPPSSNGPQLKSWAGIMVTWPDVSNDPEGGSTRIKLPPNCILKSVWLKKRAFGGSGASYRLALVNDDATHVYGISTAANQSLEHEVRSEGIGRLLTSGVDLVIRIISVSTLNYDAQSADFTVGATLTGGVSGATAKVIEDTDAGTTGTLTLGFITGTFQDNETITDGIGGSATADGTVTSQQGAGIAQLMAAGDIYVIEYL